jgi:hypothetical protein
MCDYSLQTIPNRLAVEGETLVTHRFPTYSIGMASAVELEPPALSEREPAVRRSWWASLKKWMNPPPLREKITAVCVAPGARLRVGQLPKYFRDEYGVEAMEEVRFDERTANAQEYRDVIRFGNGKAVLLQNFPEGIHFVVLSLESTESDAMVERRPEAVWPWLH